MRSHRRRCLFYALFFLEKSKGNTAQWEPRASADLLPQSYSMKNGKCIEYSRIFHTFARVKISRRISLPHYAVLPKKSGKQNASKKFKIPGFLKKHILELSPRLSPTAFWAAPFCLKKLEKHRISYRNPVFLWLRRQDSSLRSPGYEELNKLRKFRFFRIYIYLGQLYSANYF